MKGFSRFKSVPSEIWIEKSKRHELNVKMTPEQKENNQFKIVKSPCITCLSLEAFGHHLIVTFGNLPYLKEVIRTQPRFLNSFVKYAKISVILRFVTFLLFTRFSNWSSFINLNLLIFSTV